MRHHGYTDKDQIPDLDYKHVLKEYTVKPVRRSRKNKPEDQFITKDN